MSSSQQRVAPAAGSTRLFQMACRWRPTRQATSQPQAMVASSAGSRSSQENSGLNPGASLATLAAGLAGTPVCMANQITQITKAHPLKKTSVNQSIRADTLRRSVGSANAARAAMAGRASSSERSKSGLIALLTTLTSAAHNGSATCGLRSWWRQRQSVQSARGQAGQVNHTSSLPQRFQSAMEAGSDSAWGQWICSVIEASNAASASSPTTQLSSCGAAAP